MSRDPEDFGCLFLTGTVRFGYGSPEANAEGNFERPRSVRYGLRPIGFGAGVPPSRVILMSTYPYDAGGKRCRCTFGQGGETLIKKGQSREETVPDMIKNQ